MLFWNAHNWLQSLKRIHGCKIQENPWHFQDRHLVAPENLNGTLQTFTRNYPSETLAFGGIILIRFLRMSLVQILCLPHNPSKIVILLNPSFRTPHWTCPNGFPKINTCKGFWMCSDHCLLLFWMDWNFFLRESYNYDSGKKLFDFVLPIWVFPVTEALSTRPVIRESCKVLSFIWIFHCPNHFQSWGKVES